MLLVIGPLCVVAFVVFRCCSRHDGVAVWVCW